MLEAWSEVSENKQDGWYEVVNECSSPGDSKALLARFPPTEAGRMNANLFSGLFNLIGAAWVDRIKFMTASDVSHKR